MEKNRNQETRSQNCDAPGGTVPPLAQLSRPLLYALGTTLLILGLYEIVERTWFAGVDMRIIHILHLARAIVSSLVAAMVVSWMIIKTSPGFLGASLTEDELSQHMRFTEEEKNKNYARWFIAMRWIAVMVAGVLVFITVRALELLSKDV